MKKWVKGKNKRKTYVRSKGYRKKFTRFHSGFMGLYICSYCGKIIFKKHMQVDHIIAIDKANKNFIYRKLLKNKDINSIHNLTAACKHCNASKSNKGGLWVLVGKTGWFIQPLLWLFFISFLGFYSYWFFSESIFFKINIFLKGVGLIA